MKKLILTLLAALILLTQSAWAAATPAEERAMERALEYAEAIDRSYKEPAKIYALLEKSFRTQMDKDAFCEAFLKERSYPYITPLYISKPQVSIEGKTAHVIYDQAARLIGMSYEIDMVYENGDWYICDWEEFLDGSYLEKFKDTPYSLDWYYDTEEMGEGE